MILMISSILGNFTGMDYSGERRVAEAAETSCGVVLHPDLDETYLWKTGE
jgi:hypothetical protein